MEGGSFDVQSVPQFVRRIRAVTVISNVVGALVVFVFLQWLTFGTGLSGGNSRLSATIVGLYVGGAILFMSVWAPRRFASSYEWLFTGRRPTAPEKAAALSQPARLALAIFAYWGGGAALFGALNAGPFHNSAVRAFQVAATIVLGGLTTSTASFLLVEHYWRPVFAAVLSGSPPDRPASVGVGPRLILSWALGSGVALIGILVLPLARTPHSQGHVVGSAVFLAGTGLLAGFLLMVMAARSVSDPINDVRSGMRRVQAGDLDVAVTVDDGGEVGMLQAGFNEMVAGLRERLLLRDLFGRHVGDEVARHAVEHGVGLSGEVRDVSALFVDVIGSTGLAATLPPGEVVALLNELFRIVVGAVTSEGGWVNKFEGDAALCVFGAPGDQPDHAARALRAARRLRDDLAAWRRRGGLDAAIGVSSGQAVAGNIGAEERYEYTVIGDPINEAARLTEAAKSRPERLLASGASIDAAVAPDWAPAGSEVLRGRHDATQLFVPSGGPPVDGAVTVAPTMSVAERRTPCGDD